MLSSGYAMGVVLSLLLKEALSYFVWLPPVVVCLGAVAVCRGVAFVIGRCRRASRDGAAERLEGEDVRREAARGITEIEVWLSSQSRFRGLGRTGTVAATVSMRSKGSVEDLAGLLGR